MTRQRQWAHTGARAWMAHSKLSNACEAPRTVTWKALSYSFPQTSHRVAGIWDLRLVWSGLALADLFHRLRGTRGVLDLRDVGKADHAEEPPLLVGDDH